EQPDANPLGGVADFVQRCHAAAKENRYRFSLWALLGAVTMFCAAVRLGIVFLAKDSRPTTIDVILCLAFAMACGEIVGRMYGRPIKGRAFGFLAGVALLLCRFS